MEVIIDLLVKALTDTLFLTGILVVFGGMLGVFGNRIARNFQRGFGRKALMVTGFIGVPIHELSHALAALIFAHRITELKLLQRPDEQGIMGYVRHSYKQNSLYQQAGNFFIGIAPIFGGTLCIIAAMRILLPEAFGRVLVLVSNAPDLGTWKKDAFVSAAKAYFEMLRTIFTADNLKNPCLYLFLFLVVCISAHISLSTADMRGALKGLWVILLLFFILNLLEMQKFVAIVDLTKWNLILCGFLMLSLIFSAITYVISLLFS